MMDRRVFETVSRSLCDILSGMSRPFGGKVVVWGGDFRQIVPVVVRATEADIDSVTLNHSELRSHVQIFRLTQNMRTWGLKEIVEVSSRSDYKTLGMVQKLFIHIIWETQRSNFLLNCVCLLMTSRHCSRQSSQTFRKCQKTISTTNKNVDLINNTISSHLDSPGKSYYSADSLKDPNDSTRSLYPPEFFLIHWTYHVFLPINWPLV